MDFIPAKESPLFIKGFRLFTRLLFRFRFKKVWLKQEYDPCSQCKTVYFLNHHSWWGGLIPLLLNGFRLHQKARAMMEDKQMRTYPFFRKLGAFSINREEPRKTITSLRYAVRSFDRQHSSLFIYPEGTITPAGTKLEFEGGLAWLHTHLDDIDFVPVGIYMHTIRYSKPELHLHIGRPLRVKKVLPADEKTKQFETTLDNMLDDLRSSAGFDDSEFERLL